MKCQSSTTTKNRPRCFSKCSWLFLLFAYAILIFVFAAIYKCCQDYNPRAFYITADLTQEQKCSAFREQVKGQTLCGLSAQNVSDATLLQLIDEVATQPTGATVTFKRSRDGYFSATVPGESSPSDVITLYDLSADITTCDNAIVMWAGDDRSSHPLGDAWAAYYTELFRANGYESYCITSSQKVPAPVKYGERRFPLGEYQLLTVALKNKNPDMKDLNLALFFDAETFGTLWEDADPLVPNAHDTTTRGFYRILPYCLNNLDNTRIAAEAAANPPVSFCDFLYFSTITITTTGYGDILPNTTYVRLFVMVEILLGTVIFGLLLGKLTQRSPSSEQKSGD